MLWLVKNVSITQYINYAERITLPSVIPIQAFPVAVWFLIAYRNTETEREIDCSTWITIMSTQVWDTSNLEVLFCSICPSQHSLEYLQSRKLTVQCEWQRTHPWNVFFCLLTLLCLCLPNEMCAIFRPPPPPSIFAYSKHSNQIVGKTWEWGIT